MLDKLFNLDPTPELRRFNKNLRKAEKVQQEAPAKLAVAQRAMAEAQAEMNACHVCAIEEKETLLSEIQELSLNWNDFKPNSPIFYAQAAFLLEGKSTRDEILADCKSLEERQDVWLAYIDSKYTKAAKGRGWNRNPVSHALGQPYEAEALYTLHGDVKSIDKIFALEKARLQIDGITANADKKRRHAQVMESLNTVPAS